MRQACTDACVYTQSRANKKALSSLGVHRKQAKFTKNITAIGDSVNMANFGGIPLTSPTSPLPEPSRPYNNLLPCPHRSPASEHSSPTDDGNRLRQPPVPIQKGRPHGCISQAVLSTQKLSVQMPLFFLRSEFLVNYLSLPSRRVPHSLRF